MRMRLGFSIATHIEPEILLIDEVLAVGDMAFQQKCYDRIKEFKEAGCTILIVSHQINFIQEHADSVLWLDHGTVKELGPANQVVTNYIDSMTTKIAENQAQSIPQVEAVEITELPEDTDLLDKTNKKEDSTLKDTELKSTKKSELEIDISEALASDKRKRFSNNA